MRGVRGRERGDGGGGWGRVKGREGGKGERERGEGARRWVEAGKEAREGA